MRAIAINRDERLTSVRALIDAIDEATGKELLLRLRERKLRRELADADLERTKELQEQLEKVRAAVGELV